MSERSKAIKLSPLARPFTINNPFSRHESFDPVNDSSYSSNSIPEQPIPYLNSGGQSQHGNYSYHSNATAITAFPFVDDLDFEPYSSFTSYPFDDYTPVRTGFALPTRKSSRTGFYLGSSSLGNVGPQSGVQGTARNQLGLEEVLLLEQGTIEGSKLVSQKPYVLHEKRNVVVGEKIRIRPKGVDKLLTESSVFRLVNSEVNLLNECMTKSFSLSSAPSLTSSVCDSTIINNERCFPHLASCAAETLVSGASSNCVSYSAQTFKPSSAGSYNPPIVNTATLENVAYGGTDVVIDMDSYFGYVVTGIIGSDIAQSPPLDNVACQDLVITETGEKINIVEPAHKETKNPSIKAKSKLRITCPSVRETSSLEHHGAKAGIPDDDVDSPCWKGNQVYKSLLTDSVSVSLEDSKGQSPSRASVSLKSEHSKNENVARNRLNPLAPVFIPGNSKENVDYHQKECHGDSSLSYQNIGALAVVSSSREHGSMGSIGAGICRLERINDIGIHCSTDAHDSRNEYDTPYNSCRSSVVNSSCSFRPYTGKSMLHL